MKRILMLMILSFPICAFANVDGVWQCNVKVKTTAKANGRTTKGIDFSSSTQTLLPDGSYNSISPVSPIVARGTYVLRKHTIIFNPNYDDLIDVAQQACSQAGGSCQVTAISGSNKWALNKAFTTMMGKGTLKMTMMVNGSVLVRTVGVSSAACIRR